ncbi:MAG TPA: glycosyltransferase family 1 protein [Nitrospirae bacterium]|nr:glycosyltransferase family 1 protein [Nitrospirota bacterium]
MKIAFYNLTTTTKAGGIETFNWEMAGTLASRGHTVHIYGGEGEALRETPANVEVYQYSFIRRESVPDLGTRFRKFVERLTFGTHALRYLVKRNYDYIYISKPYDLPIALIVSKWTGAKVIFGSQGTEFFPGYKYLAKRVSYFFSCSEFNAGQIDQYCKIRPRVLPNGVNTGLFRPHFPDQEIKHNLKISDTDHIIISACRLIGWKGIQYSIKAAAELISRGYAIKYLIIGDGEYAEDLSLLVKKLKVEDNVIFLGNKRNSELPGYYSVAGIAVFPSVADETFGIAIAEAMACGLSVVSTAVGGIPEVIAKDTGILVPPKNEKALVDVIEQLMLDDDLRGRMGNRASRHISENFNWANIAGKFERYLNNE